MSDFDNTATRAMLNALRAKATPVERRCGTCNKVMVPEEASRWMSLHYLCPDVHEWNPKVLGEGRALNQHVQAGTTHEIYTVTHGDVVVPRVVLLALLDIADNEMVRQDWNGNGATGSKKTSDALDVLRQIANDRE